MLQLIYPAGFGPRLSVLKATKRISHRTLALGDSRQTLQLHSTDLSSRSNVQDLQTLELENLTESLRGNDERSITARTEEQMKMAVVVSPTAR